jgi:DNA-binding SARP family transcriptional activator
LPIPAAAQRLISFLALHEHPLQRVFVAGSLWLDSSEQHSAGSLRSTLWRLGQCGRIVDITGSQLALSDEVGVDVRDAMACARRLVTRNVTPRDGDMSTLAATGELLPDFYDDWIVLERERFRQLRIHALECLSTWFSQNGRHAEAVEAGLAAVTGEPLRESAHRTVVAAHLAEGNVVEALRQYSIFRRLLKAELGLEPSPAMEAIVSPVAQAKAVGALLR